MGAKARAEAAEIEGRAAVQMATLRADAQKIESESELHRLKAHQAAEIAHQRELVELEIAKATEMATIESDRFAATVSALGADTIAAMAEAGPEMQARLLKGLGLKGYIVT